MCDKVPYSSKRAAQEKLNGIKYFANKVRQKNKIPVRSYYCEECKAYHLTSRADKSQKLRRK